ncbi:MAG: hypothetical protein KDK24_00990 [Pseudooceanicola sp.]|nr:hypothetical protein [Pseudooceanicola sp.]
MIVPDTVATHNERVKLHSGALNATGLTLIALGFLRPLTENRLVVVTESQSFEATVAALKGGTSQAWSQKWLNPELQPLVEQSAPGVFSTIPSFAWFVMGGLALHLMAPYVLRYMRKAA